MKKEEILKLMNASNSQTLMQTLSIDFIDFGKDYLIAKMPVTPRIHQPDGILRGGATFALAETVEEKRSSYIYNNLSSEYTECQHYYLIASEAMKTNDPDSKIIKLGQQAAGSGYQSAISNGLKAYNADAGGVPFRIYVDPKTGIVTNFHPR